MSKFKTLTELIRNANQTPIDTEQRKRRQVQYISKKSLYEILEKHCYIGARGVKLMWYNELLEELESDN